MLKTSFRLIKNAKVLVWVCQGNDLSEEFAATMAFFFFERPIKAHQLSPQNNESS